MKINNETIMKLTNAEMNDLGCMSIGINLVRGTLKTRTKGWKRVQVSDKEFHFTNEMSDYRYEFVALASTSNMDGVEVQEWAVRLYNEICGSYETFQNVLASISFLK